MTRTIAKRALLLLTVLLTMIPLESTAQTPCRKNEAEMYAYLAHEFGEVKTAEALSLSIYKDIPLHLIFVVSREGTWRLITKDSRITGDLFGVKTCFFSGGSKWHTPSPEEVAASKTFLLEMGDSKDPVVIALFQNEDMLIITANKEGNWTAYVAMINTAEVTEGDSGDGWKLYLQEEPDGKDQKLGPGI